MENKLAKIEHDLVSSTRKYRDLDSRVLPSYVRQIAASYATQLKTAHELKDKNLTAEKLNVLIIHYFQEGMVSHPLIFTESFCDWAWEIEDFEFSEPPGALQLALRESNRRDFGKFHLYIALKS